MGARGQIKLRQHFLGSTHPQVRVIDRDHNHAMVAAAAGEVLIRGESLPAMLQAVPRLRWMLLALHQLRIALGSPALPTRPRLPDEE